MEQIESGNVSDTVSESESTATSPRRKRRRLCYYNDQWGNAFTWLENVPGNSTKARCKLCAATFSIAYDGKNAVSAHEIKLRSTKNSMHLPLLRTD